MGRSLPIHREPDASAEDRRGLHRVLFALVHRTLSKLDLQSGWIEHQFP